MTINKAQTEFAAAISKLGNAGHGKTGSISFKPIIHVTVPIKSVSPKDEMALRQKIYDLEMALMASDPDTSYDFRITAS